MRPRANFKLLFSVVYSVLCSAVWLGCSAKSSTTCTSGRSGRDCATIVASPQNVSATPAPIKDEPSEDGKQTAGVTNQSGTSPSAEATPADTTSTDTKADQAANTNIDLKTNGALSVTLLSPREVFIEWNTWSQLATKVAYSNSTVAAPVGSVSYKLICVPGISSKLDTVTGMAAVMTAQPQVVMRAVAPLVLPWIWANSVYLRDLRPDATYTCNVTAEDANGTQAAYQSADFTTFCR